MCDLGSFDFMHLIMFAALALAAAESPTTKISAEQRAKFWRAQAEAIAAQAQYQSAKSALDAVQAELQKACGDGVLALDQAGEPSCKAKPETLKKQAP